MIHHIMYCYQLLSRASGWPQCIAVPQLLFVYGALWSMVDFQQFRFFQFSGSVQSLHDCQLCVAAYQSKYCNF